VCATFELIQEILLCLHAVFPIKTI